MATVFKQASAKIRRGRYLGRALGLVWRSGPSWMIANAGLIAIQGMLPAISLYLMKLLVDTLSHPVPPQPGSLIPERVIVLLAAIGGAALLVAVCRSLGIWLSEAQSQSVTDHVHDLLHCKAMAVDLAYYENSNYYDTLHRATQEAPYRPSRIVNGLVQLVQSTASLIAVAALLLTLHWLVAFLLLGAVLPAGFVRLRYADTLYRWYRERTPRERKAAYLNWLLTSDSHAKEIRLFDLGERFRQGYLALRRGLREEKLAMVGRHALTDLLAQTVSTAAAVFCYGYVTFQAVRGIGTLGDLFMYLLAFQRAQSFLQEALSSATRLYEDTLFLTHFSPAIWSSRSHLKLFQSSLLAELPLRASVFGILIAQNSPLMRLLSPFRQVRLWPLSVKMAPANQPSSSCFAAYTIQLAVGLPLKERIYVASPRRNCAQPSVLFSRILDAITSAQARTSRSEAPKQSR
jgi:ATP-binding cassette, subfamily B, bacterial